MPATFKYQKNVNSLPSYSKDPTIFLEGLKGEDRGG